MDGFCASLLVLDRHEHVCDVKGSPPPPKSTQSGQNDPPPIQGQRDLPSTAEKGVDFPVRGEASHEPFRKIVEETSHDTVRTWTHVNKFARCKWMDDVEEEGATGTDGRRTETGTPRMMDRGWIWTCVVHAVEGDGGTNVSDVETRTSECKKRRVSLHFIACNPSLAHNLIEHR